MAENQPLRILMVLRAPVGGLFRHVIDLTCSLAERGHHIGIIADSTTGSTQAKNTLESLQGVARLGIERMPISRLPALSDIHTQKKMRAIAKKMKVECIHGHGAKGGAHARIAAKNLGIPSLYTPHGGSLHYKWKSLSGALFLSTEKYLLKHTDAIVFESHYAHKAYTQKIEDPGPKTHIIPNGLTPEEFRPVTKDETSPYDLLYVGELRSLKGVIHLIKAIPDVKNNKGEPAKLLIVGSGPEEEECKALVKTLNLEDRIHFAGAKPAAEMFNKADLLIVPSLAESLPYIVLEASAAQLPVIATDVGGISEIFGPTSSSLISPASAQALKEKIRSTLLALNTAREEADTRFHHVKKTYNINTMTDAIENLYLSLAR